MLPLTLTALLVYFELAAHPHKEQPVTRLVTSLMSLTHSHTSSSLSLSSLITGVFFLYSCRLFPPVAVLLPSTTETPCVTLSSLPGGCAAEAREDYIT